MLYHDFLKTSPTCPFCTPRLDALLTENALASLTYSLAPYHQYHLLVVPNRHLENWEELSTEEELAINHLLRKGTQILRTFGYTDYSILVRNGAKSGKSVPHVHYHIVPVDIIGDLDHKDEERKILTEAERSHLAKALRAVL